MDNDHASSPDGGYADTGDQLRLIESELRSIRERNLRVETDKAWEVSSFRILSIAGLIYIVVSLFLLSMHMPQFLLHALVPPLGYILSVQTLPILKRWWIHHRRGQNASS